MSIRTRSWYPVVVGLCAVLAIACGGSNEDSGPDATAAADSAPARVPSAAPGSEALLPAVGSVEVVVESEGRVSARANLAPRGAIVSALAEALGFALVLGEAAELSQPLTLQVENETPEVVLAQVLAGVPHGLAYEGDASGRRLARLTVGATTAIEAPPVVASAPRTSRRARSERPELTPEEQRERAERSERLWVESLENVGSPNSDVRADAVTWLNVDSSEGFEAATDRQANDASPLVRAAPAEALARSDTGAVQPLLQALGDTQPPVVLAALDALEFAGDETTVPHLAPLLKHQNTEVRERAVEAIEFLQ
jgi:hypothetical protein